MPTRPKNAHPHAVVEIQIAVSAEKVASKHLPAGQKPARLPAHCIFAYSRRLVLKSGSGLYPSPMMSEQYQFVKGLRAIRDYEARPLQEDDLVAILEAARWTGSAKNRQDWSFIVVREDAQLARLAECGDYTVPLRNSAATIVLVVEPGGYEFDAGRLAQNIMLAADAIGVASCPITLHRESMAQELLGVGEGRSCRYAVALGYPAPGSGPRRFGGRKPLEDLVHYEQY